VSKILLLLQTIYFNLTYIKNRLALRVRGASYGKNLEIFTSFLMQDVQRLKIGDNVLIGKQCNFYAGSGIKIGDNVMIGNNVSIISNDHEFKNKSRPMKLQHLHYEKTPVVIEDDVLMGDKAIILKKVRVSRGSIVGAGAVVTKNVPEYTIVGGNPAKIIGTR